jgi:hypothetical protein
MSPTPSVSRDTSEEAIIAHHHLSPTPTRSQNIQNTPDASPISDRAITEYHHHGSASVLPSSITSRPNTRQLNTTELTDPVKPSEIDTEKATSFKSDSLSDINGGSSLLRPFAYPVSTLLPSPPLTPLVKRSIIGGPFLKHTTQSEVDVESEAEKLVLQEPFVLSTPPRNVSTSVQAFNEPITPSRLGPSWKTETAPQSVIDEEEIDELESESDDDEDELDTPILSRIPLDPQHSFGRSLSQEKIETEQEQDVDMENPYSNAWALEYGIDPKQWDETLTKSPTQITQNQIDMDAQSESDAGFDNAGEGFSGEEDDDDDMAEEDEEDAVEGECGYRVFAGWADIESMNSAQRDDQYQATTPGSSIKSFGSLTPRRPTAFEATTGGRYEQYLSSHRPNSASPGSSTGRVSAQLRSPLAPLSRDRGRSVTAELSPSHLFDSKFHYESINSTPDRQRGSVAGGNMPKRDQVILALLQVGHVTLAEDVLRGYTADILGKQD